MQHKAPKAVWPWVVLCHNSPVSQPRQLEVSTATTRSLTILCRDEKLILYYNEKHSSQWLPSGELPKPKLNKKTDHFLRVYRWNYLFYLPAAWQKNRCRIVLWTPEKNVLRMQPTLVTWKGTMLLHDNAWPHVSQIVVQKLNELEVWNYLLYCTLGARDVQMFLENLWFELFNKPSNF